MYDSISKSQDKFQLIGRLELFIDQVKGLNTIFDVNIAMFVERPESLWKYKSSCV